MVIFRKWPAGNHTWQAGTCPTNGGSNHSHVYLEGKPTIWGWLYTPFMVSPGGWCLYVRPLPHEWHRMPFIRITVSNRKKGILTGLMGYNKWLYYIVQWGLNQLVYNETWWGFSLATHGLQTLCSSPNPRSCAVNWMTVPFGSLALALAE